MDKNDARRQKRFSALIIYILIAIVLINLILPLITLLGKVFDYTPFYDGLVKTLSSQTTKTALWNSVAVSSVSSAIAIVAAFFFAYIVELKLDDKMKKLFRFASILPMLVPSITHGLVIVYLFGKKGILTGLLGFQLPIYGQLGIIMGSFFYAFPLAFLVFSQSFINLDGRLFENAQVLGVKPFRRFFGIVLPMMRYTIFSAFVVCFTMIFTDYGIPLSVGGTYPILPLQFYKNVIGLLDFPKGAIYSVLILLPAVLLYLVDVFYFSKKQTASSHNIRKVDSGRFHPLQVVFFVFLTAIILIVMLVIVVAPFVKAWPYDATFTLQHFRRIIQVDALGKLIVNSIVIALCTGIAGTLVTLFAGYMYTRDPYGLKFSKKLMHGLYMIALAVPGLALGLSFALFFKGSFIYNTLGIMIIVNIIHFLGSPYMMTISHFKLLNPNLEAICRTLGGNFWNVMMDVIIPNSKKMLTDVFVYFFTNTMVTISAISLLYSADHMTLALQITAYNDQGNWESAVAISLVILVVNIVAKALQSFRRDKTEALMTYEEPPYTQET